MVYKYPQIWREICFHVAKAVRKMWYHKSKRNFNDSQATRGTSDAASQQTNHSPIKKQLIICIIKQLKIPIAKTRHGGVTCFDNKCK